MLKLVKNIHYNFHHYPNTPVYGDVSFYAIETEDYIAVIGKYKNSPYNYCNENLIQNHSTCLMILTEFDDDAKEAIEKIYTNKKVYLCDKMLIENNKRIVPIDY